MLTSQNRNRTASNRFLRNNTFKIHSYHFSKIIMLPQNFAALFIVLAIFQILFGKAGPVHADEPHISPPGTAAFGFQSSLARIAHGAMAGDVELQYGLGDILVGSMPKERSDKNLQEGLFWLHAAAERGHAKAQGKLGSTYLFEPRVTDTATGFYWLVQSVQKANEFALISIFLALGDPAQSFYDPRQALYWAEVAIANGEGPALYTARAYKSFWEPEVSETERVSLTEKANQCFSSGFVDCAYSDLPGYDQGPKPFTGTSTLKN